MNRGPVAVRWFVAVELSVSRVMQPMTTNRLALVEFGWGLGGAAVWARSPTVAVHATAPIDHDSHDSHDRPALFDSRPRLNAVSIPACDPPFPQPIS
jgi:hypothetical protein